MTVRLSTLGKLGLGLLLSLAVSAEDMTTSGIVPTPNPPKAKEKFSAEQDCVAPKEIIRRNHGHFLKHQRDETMRRGVRTTQHSLVACINCHVTPDETGNYPSIKEGTEHFCRSCHSYAAVNIDCFQCHASQPEK
ncbi:MAG: Hdr-like menaquinol oxidoreductase cytochrome c subunit [Pseudomonadota bacterium]